MKIRIDAVPGETPPPETFVSMRVGDVQKQTRFENSRTYRFPEPSDEIGSFGRIEVFKRIGTLTVPLDHYRNGANSVEVPCSYPKFTKLCLNMAVLDADAPDTNKDASKEVNKGYAKKRINDAQQYLSNFSIEDVLAEAMREVIRDRPDDPYRYLASYILKQSSDPDLIICPSYQHQPEGQKPIATIDASATLFEGSPAPFKRLPSVGTWLSPLLPQPAVAERQADFPGDPFPIRPSVGTWLMRESPDVKRPWYYHVRHAGEHTGYVRDLQKVISSKDDELDRLKAQAAELELLKAQLAMLQASGQVPLSPVQSGPEASQVAIESVVSPPCSPPIIQAGPKPTQVAVEPTLANFSEFYKAYVLSRSGAVDCAVARFGPNTSSVTKQPKENLAGPKPTQVAGEPTLANFSEFYKAYVLSRSGAVDCAVARFGPNTSSVTKQPKENLGNGQQDFGEELRQKVQDALCEATLTGKLGAAMVQSAQDTTMDLRQTAQQALCEATLTGKLGATVVQSYVDVDISAALSLCPAFFDPENVSQDLVSELRTRTQQALVEAASNGRLSDLLSEVRREAAPGAINVSQSFKKLASVGTWLQTRPMARGSEVM